ncbi:MAG: branched-chain amino acid ABC transporter permease [Nitrospirae bacterium]|nr:branched-chain amino acid ABC transporter permease [Nitrospirota bacterium]MCL5237114.1 branched-chain amino acid ABC transporter permease [Nitrospirota bacterium]
MIVLQILINGLLLGAFYALIGIGFSLVWGVTNIINLAHGAIALLGAYLTFFMFQQWHVDPFLTIPVSFTVMFIVGYMLQRYLMNLVVKAQIFILLILTFGLEIFLVNFMTTFFSADFRSVTPDYAGHSLILGDIVIPYIRMAVFFICVAAAALMALFLDKTWQGKAIRATSLDIEAAMMTGISPAKIYALTFAIGSGVAGVAGTLLTLTQAFSPNIAGGLTLRAFIVSILGGLGRVEGALLGGLVLGVLETFSSYIVGESYKNAIAFGLMVLVLIVKPSGLMGRKYYAEVKH